RDPGPAGADRRLAALPRHRARLGHREQRPGAHRRGVGGGPVRGPGGAAGAQSGAAGGSQTSSETADQTSMVSAPLVKERLFAHPARAASYAAGGRQQLQDVSDTISNFKNYFADALHLAKNQYTLEPLQAGSIRV